MTLKKTIANLVKAEHGSVRLNKIATLERWTKNAIGEDVDMLVIHFDTINDLCIKGCYSIDIKSREYDGIITECCEATQTFFTEANSQITTDLKSGYWFGSRKASWTKIFPEETEES